MRREGRIDEARRIYGNLRRLEPDNYPSFFREIELTRDEGAREALREELALLVASAKDDGARSAYLGLESTMIESRPEREQLLEEAIMLDTQNAIAHYLYAMSLEERREDDLAYEHWRAAATGRSPPPEVFFKLAQREVARHQRSEAVRLFEVFLSYEPEDVGALYNVGTIHLENGAPDKAEPFLRRANELDRQDLDVVINLATAAIQNGRRQLALEKLEQARRLSPDDPTIYFNLAVVHANYLDEKEKAILYFRRYLELGGPRNRRVEAWIAQLSEEDGS